MQANAESEHEEQDDNEDDCDEDDCDDDDENIVTSRELATKIGRKSRSFCSLPMKYQAVAGEARIYIDNYTLFKKALLVPGEGLKLVIRAWNHSLKGLWQLEQTKQVEIYVCEQDPPNVVGMLIYNSSKVFTLEHNPTWYTNVEPSCLKYIRLVTCAKKTSKNRWSTCWRGTGSSAPKRVDM